MTSDYSLEARTADDANVAIVQLTGEIDLTNASELEARLEDVLAANQGLVLDLNMVTFIDSAALHVLFRFARRLGRDRFGIAVDANAVVFRALAIGELSKVATLRESIDDCLTAVATVG